jgi:hypothetical protein
MLCRFAATSFAHFNWPRIRRNHASEADVAAFRRRRVHQLADGGEDGGNGLIVSAVTATAQLEVANCDLKVLISFLVSWNMKSAGKRSALRLTASFKRPVVTP